MSVRNGGVKHKVKNSKTKNMYFLDLHKDPIFASPSVKARDGVLLKYAFKLMQDLITHLHWAQILSLPLSLHLLSLLIFVFLPLFPIASLNPASPPSHTHTRTHTFSLPLRCSLSDLLSLLQGTHYLLGVMEFLKRQKSKQGKRRGVILEAWDTKTSTFLSSSFNPSFVLPFTPIPPSTVSVTSVVLSLSLLTLFMFSLPGSSIMCCRQRSWHCHVIIPYSFKYSCPVLALPSFYTRSGGLDSRPWLENLHVIIKSQWETLDWPTGPTTQRDPFDFTLLSVGAEVFKQQQSHDYANCFYAPTRLTGYKYTISNLEDTFYYRSFSSMQTYSFNLRNLCGSLTP